jgi:hypothetical protein
MNFPGKTGGVSVWMPPMARFSIKITTLIMIIGDTVFITDKAAQSKKNP